MNRDWESCSTVVVIFVKNALCGETQILSTESTGVSNKSFVGQGQTKVPKSSRHSVA